MKNEIWSKKRYLKHQAVAISSERNINLKFLFIIMVPHIINHPERLNQHKTTDTTLIAAPSDRVRQHRDQQPVDSALWES